MNVIGYTELGSIRIEVDGEELFVPDDPRNRHRQVIAEWEAAGNAIPPAPVLDPEPLPPLTARQLRLGLIAAGISIAGVDGAIDAIEDATDREVARVEWEYASQFEREHPLLVQVGAELGLTPEQIDAAWLAATEL